MTKTEPKEKCPICKAPADAQYLPFCSRRCANIDLHRWLSGGYAIAGRDDDEPDAGSGVREQPASPTEDQERDED